MVRASPRVQNHPLPFSFIYFIYNLITLAKRSCFSFITLSITLSGRDSLFEYLRGCFAPWGT